MRRWTSFLRKIRKITKKAAKQAAYKRELEAQLRERNLTNGTSKKERYAPPREFIIQTDNKYENSQKVEKLELDDVRIPSPPTQKNETTPRATVDVNYGM